MDCIRDEIGNIWGQNAEGDLDRSIVDAMFNQVYDLSNHETHHDAHGRQIAKPQNAGAEGWCVPSYQQGNSEFQCEQSTGIVDQTLPLENIDNTFRKSDALGN